MEALAYVGALENEETLEWHAAILLNHLASLLELDEYPTSFPWRCIATLSAPLQQETLLAMKAEWSFATGFVDSLRKGTLYHELAVARQQPYRDLMVQAERLDFTSE